MIYIKAPSQAREQDKRVGRLWVRQGAAAVGQCPEKGWHMIRVNVYLCATALAVLCGCADVDVPPARGISQDIEATHQPGATSLRPGQSQHNEPVEREPWRLEEYGPTQQ
jgi:hypothetical protein